MFLQQGNQFFFECNGLVVIFLILYVFDEFVFVFIGTCKCRISILPAIKISQQALCFDKACCGEFNVFDQW